MSGMNARLACLGLRSAVLCGLLPFMAFAQSADQQAMMIRSGAASLAAKKAAVTALLETEPATGDKLVSAAAAALGDPASSDDWRLFLLRSLALLETERHDDYAAVARLFLDNSKPEELRFAAAERLTVILAGDVGTLSGEPSPSALLRGAAGMFGDRRFPSWLRQASLRIFAEIAADQNTKAEDLLVYLRGDAPLPILKEVLSSLGPSIGTKTRISDDQAAQIVQLAFKDPKNFGSFPKEGLQGLAQHASCRPLLLAVAGDLTRPEAQRVFALNALSDAADDPQVVALSSALNSDQSAPSKVRTAALVLLSRTKNAPQNVVPQLYEIVKKGDRSESLNAIEVLGKISSNKDLTVRVLVDFIKTRRGTPVCPTRSRDTSDPDFDDFGDEPAENPCETAIQTIGSLKADTDDALPFLRDLLSDETYWSDATTTLMAYGKDAVLEAKPDLIKQLRRHNASRPTLNALRTMGWKAVDTIPMMVNVLLREVRLSARASMTTSTIDSIRNDAIASTGEMSAGEIGRAIRHIDEAIGKLSAAKISNKNLQSQVETLIVKLRAANKALQDARKLKFVSLFETRWARIAGVVLLWILIALTACAILLRLRPLWILAIHNFVKRYATIRFFGIEIPIGDVLLVSFFVQRDRVLDAWVSKHVVVARQRFRAKETVKARLNNVALPVEFEGERHDNGLPRDEMTRLFANKTCLLVRAEGGAGKTSLAVQIALNAIADDIPPRFMPYRALPVMLEEDLPAPDKDGKSRLIEVVAGRLADLIGGAETISPDLLDRLLRRGRVLVIIDHLSEMSERTRDQINPAASDFPIRSLIVTSRIKENLSGAVVANLRPLRIQWSSVARFLQLYLAKEEKLDKISQGDFHRHCASLVELAGDGEVTVLMAKLFAELVATAGPIPTTNPDLVMEYLNHLNETRSAGDPDNLTLQRASASAAYACLIKTFSPKPTLREEVLAAIGLPNADQLLDYLERLGIVQVSGAGRLVKFMLDPVAEYLAAIRIVEMKGADEVAWTALLAEPSLAIENTDLVRGFLHALAEAIRAREEMRVPSSVIDAIEPRLRALRLVA
jgi:hypothetical protein